MAEINETPRSNRIHIAFFGLRNAGKSTLVNAFTGQSLAIVSDTPGTTTDPVSKAMEILPLGPCLVTDTAGLDDDGALGAMRVKKSLEVLDTTDIAVWVSADADDAARKRFEASCRERGIVMLEYNRGESVEELKSRVASVKLADDVCGLFDGLIFAGDHVVLVCPIDASAPKGRLILPQVQAIRECLDRHASCSVCQVGELADTVAHIGEDRVKLVVTDSQAFAEVDAILSATVPLTSFSILFARQKGDLKTLCAGAEAIRSLRDGDTVLISEGCTHHRQCGDIGTVKLPKLLAKATGAKLDFIFSSGADFPIAAAKRPKLVIHCGGCMLTRRAVLARLARCAEAGIPIVNYGVAIAAMNGIVADPETCRVRRAKR